MHILYFDWDEFNGEDCRDAMKRLGHEVEVFKVRRDVFDLTDELMDMLKSGLDRASAAGDPIDLVFSFNFFPNISEGCQKLGIKYVSWVFDCPHKTLCSPQVFNDVNDIHIFDRLMCEDLERKGVKNVHHTPLAVNKDRLSKYCSDLDLGSGGQIVYQHDVSFIGNLYDNEFNFYDQIKGIPGPLKDYIDAVISAQEKIFSMDFFTDESVVNTKHIESIDNYVIFEKSGKYDIDYHEVILDMLRKKVTVNERRHILEKMGENYDTVLYTAGDIKPIKNVCNLGFADYMTRMPRVFRRSKVNLNITLRSIRSGIPLRILDILAAGGFALTNYQPEIGENFTDGVHLAMCVTPEEMVQKAGYYLQHEDERKEIAEKGREKVWEEFSYERILSRILG